jgi:AraC-like DNA-binding protein
MVRRQHNGPDFLDAQIVFQPTAVFRLTGVPAIELIDQYIEADQLFPKYVNEIFAQLQEFSSYHHILATLEDFVRMLIRSATSAYNILDTVITDMRTGTGDQSLASLAGQACLSTRQFERKFLQRVGVHPKAYSKLIRFNRAYNLKNRFPDQSWLGIAMAQGYHDYQHLVKDYRQFTGMSPRELHLIESNSPESVLGLARSIYRKRV